MSESNPIARRVHDLVRRPDVLRHFKAQTEMYLSERLQNQGMAWPFGMADLHDARGPLASLGEMYATLAAYHDTAYPDNRIMRHDRPDLPLGPIWMWLLDHVRNNASEENLKDWCEDVVTDLQRLSSLAERVQTPVPPAPTVVGVIPNPVEETSSSPRSSKYLARQLRAEARLRATDDAVDSFLRRYRQDHDCSLNNDSRK